MTTEGSEPSKIDIGRDVGPGAAVGPDASVEAENIASRDVYKASRDIHIYQGDRLPDAPAYEPPPLPEPGKLPQPGPLPPGTRMMFGRNPLFTGREAELLKLADTLLYQPGRSDVIAMQTAVASGLGGIGKTQLAAEFVYRYGRFFAGGVYWLSFALPATIPSEIAACGRIDALNLHPDFDHMEVDLQVALVQRAWQEPTLRLLIFDNCEDETLLTQWRPKTGGCQVLVTSRRSRWHRQLGVTTFPLDVLQRRESIVLLRRFMPDLAETEANEIAAELGDLPLALHLAGSFLMRYGSVISPSAYLAQLRDKALLTHPSLQGKGEKLSMTDHELHVGRTFALSYNQLDSENEVDNQARQLLACATCFAPGEPIPKALLLATVTQERDEPAALMLAADSLNRLLELGLLRQEADETLLLHRLLAEFVRGLVDTDAAQAAVEQALLAVLDNHIDQAGYLGLSPVLATHLRVITDRALLRRDETAADLCNWLGQQLREVGDFQAARPYLEQALAICRQALGEQHPDTATILSNLGRLLHNMGDFQAARPYLEQALVIYRQLLGEQHPYTAQSLNNLGRLLHDMGDLPATREYYEQALVIYRQVLGKQHPYTAISLNNLGRLLRKMGDFETAREYYEQALAIRRQALGEQHPHTAAAYVNVARTDAVFCRHSDLYPAQPGQKPFVAYPFSALFWPSGPFSR